MIQTAINQPFVLQIGGAVLTTYLAHHTRREALVAIEFSTARL